MYDQSDTLLLADVFNNFWNMSPEINQLDPSHFLSPPVLAWQAAFKKTKVKSVNYYSGVYELISICY